MPSRRTVALALAAGLAGLAATPWAAGGPGRMPALDGATGWANSPPLTTASLRGKVVLVDFWTYSCINCLRMLPYVRAWAQKYQAHGLVVLGIHTPEFGFERQHGNVMRAARELGTEFPVAIDSNRALWRAFGTRGWPTLYFVDGDGRIRHEQVGEGGYERAERVIQQLLREAGRSGWSEALVSPQGQGTQAAAGAVAAASDETYLGSARASGFSAQADPRALKSNRWTLAGAWAVEPELARLKQAGGRVAYRFRARDLHMVLGPALDGQAVRFRVRIDGMPPGEDRGTDVDRDGLGRVDAHRLYQMVRQASDPADRLFEIEFLDPGVLAYAFTFG